MTGIWGLRHQEEHRARDNVKTSKPSLLVHTSHGAEHLGPDDRERNTARGALSQLYLWHTEAVLQRDNNDEGVILLRQLANLLLEILRLQLNPTRGPAHVLERCEDILLPSPYKHPSKLGQHQLSTLKCLASERKLRSSAQKRLETIPHIPERER